MAEKHIEPSGGLTDVADVSRCVISAKNVLTSHEDYCHILDIMFCLHFILHFDTVLRSSVWKRNVNFLLTATVYPPLIHEY